MTGTSIRFEVVSAFSSAGTPPRWHTLGDIAGMPTDLSTPSGSPFVVQIDRSEASQGRWVVDAAIRVDPRAHAAASNDDRSNDDRGSVSVPYSLRRVYQLHPAPPALPRKVLVNDTLTSRVPTTIGLHIRHHAKLLGDATTVADVEVPGRFEPGMCGTENNQGVFGTPFHPTNFGRPDIFLEANGSSTDPSHIGGGGSSSSSSPTAAAAALGMVALDDAFRVHGEAWNSALPSLNSRVAMTCTVTTPPSIRLSDPRLALSPGETHTTEWALFPLGGNCTSYWCFLNLMRNDFGTDKIIVGENMGAENAVGNSPSFRVNDGAHAGNQFPWNGSGWTDPAVRFPSEGQADPRCLMPDGTHCPIWQNWTAETLRRYFTQQGVTVIPTGNGWNTCKMPEQQYSLCRTPSGGAAFAYQKLPDLDAWIPTVLETAARATAAMSDGPQKTKIKTSFYMETHISTRGGDSTTFKDCRVLDSEGQQVCYNLNTSRPKNQPATGLEQPAFYPTLENSFGKMVIAYLEKVFAMGMDGIWHDDYGEFGGKGGYTFDTFDNRTAFLHASNLSLQYKAASLALISLPLEMKLKDMTEAHGGFMTCNGAPLTRTEILRGFGQHDAENAMQQVSQHVQLYTPVMLTRPPGGCSDPDPKYFRNASTMDTGLYDPVHGCGAACWNILNHLDDGVLSELDQVPLPMLNSSGGGGGSSGAVGGSTLQTYLFPLTPIELGEGFVIGKEKVITKVSGIFRNRAATSDSAASSAGAAGAGSATQQQPPTRVYLYEDCAEVAATQAGGASIEGVRISAAAGGGSEVELSLQPAQQAIILWGVPSLEIV